MTCKKPCIVRSEDDFRDDPEAPTMDVEEVPEDSIDNVVGFENFDSDISEDSPKKGDIELLKTPLLCGVADGGGVHQYQSHPGG